MLADSPRSSKATVTLTVTLTVPDWDAQLANGIYELADDFAKPRLNQAAPRQHFRPSVALRS